MDGYSNHTDNDLIKLLFASDELAFETIYRRYAADLNRFTYSKTGNRDDSEEIVQDIFVWLWTNRHDLARITNLKTYLFQAAKNRVLNYYRAARIRTEYANSFALFKATHENATDENLELSELRAQIERNLNDLPERCQVAFRMSRIENIPIAGIAAEMAISHRTVENYISQALKHLRKKVGTSE